MQRRAWTRLDWVAVTAVTVVAAVLRLVGLAKPSGFIFDEVYYVPDSCYYIHPGESMCNVAREMNTEHPPLGKWLIAAGEAIFDVDEFGWRIMAVVAGVATVALLYVLARKLLDSSLAATVASGLLALDLLHFVQSRVAMLDVFLGLFVVAAFTCLVFDRDALFQGKARVPARPWRLAAGAFGGAAIATKWSGVFTLLAVVCISLAWEMKSRDPGTRGRAFIATVRSAAGPMAVAFAVVPLAVYALTFVGRVHGSPFPWRDESWVKNFAARQADAFEYHASNSITNPFISQPWSWLLLKRPIAYRYEVSDDRTEKRQLTATGSPVAWWASIPALLVVIGVWAARNDPRRPEGVIVGGFLWNYLPWIGFWLAPFILGSERGALFIFYVVPMLPFMYLALAWVATRMWERRVGRAGVVAYMGVVTAAFAFYYPILTFRPLSNADFDNRIGIFDDCKKPDRAPLTVIIEKTRDGVVTRTTKTRARIFLPPEGWCWTEPTHGSESRTNSLLPDPPSG